jgi:anti-sigma regulatory factor (Ser/Thr protein kinase)
MGSGGSEILRVSVPSDPVYLGPLRTVISESTDILGLDEEVTNKIVLAVTEACANIIRHCYGGEPGQRIDVTLRFGPGFYEVQIDDYGEFVDPAEMKGRELDDVKPGGLGLHFIHSVMDGVEYRQNRWGGTTLTMRKNIGPLPDTGSLVPEE